MNYLAAAKNDGEGAVGCTALLARPGYSANDSKLADVARGIASCLTYNDDKTQAEAKHTLLEMAHRLDARNIWVSKWEVRNCIGKRRAMTIKARALWLLFKNVPSRV